MAFYETNEYGGRTDNWVGPSIPCVSAFCRTAGFARAEQCGILEFSASFACYRRFRQPSAPEPLTVLQSVCHNLDYGINFSTQRDDYVTAFFSCEAANLSIDDVKPEVEGFGVRPLHVAATESGWQTNFKLPPGLSAGWNSVTVRVKNGPLSLPMPIAVDIPLEATEIIITGLRDGTRWTEGQIDQAAGGVLTLWAMGLPENADRANTWVVMGGQYLPFFFLEPGPAAQNRQLNVRVPAAFGLGQYQIFVQAGTVRSAPRVISVV